MSSSKTESGWIRWLLVSFSLMIGLYALRFLGVPFGKWLFVEDDIRSVILATPVAALSHMIFGPVALLTGAVQIIPAVRMRRPGLHRWMGRVYVVACLGGGLAGLLTAPHVSGGVVAATGFTILALLWLAFTLLAWRAAWLGNYTLHRKLVAYSFALTFAAVTYRLNLALGFAFNPNAHYSDISPWASFTAWLPNLLVVWLYQRRGNNRPARA